LTSPEWLPRQSLNTSIPLSLTEKAYISSRHREGLFYPFIRVDILNPHTMRPFWSGIGGGTAGNSDLRVVCQSIGIFLLGEFPKGPLSYDHIMNPYGFGFFVMTYNGNHYYPTVFKLIGDSPAERSGIKQYDMISSIDGISLKNRPLTEVIKLFRNEASTSKDLTVLRLDKEIHLKISPRSMP
jgi:hypothetical protein